MNEVTALRNISQQALDLARQVPNCPPDVRKQLQKTQTELAAYADNIPISKLQDVREMFEYIFVCRLRLPSSAYNFIYKRDNTLRVSNIVAPLSVNEKKALAEKIIQRDDYEKAQRWVHEDWPREVGFGHFNSYEDLITKSIEAFDGLFTYKELNALLDSINPDEDRSINVSYSRKLFEILMNLPVVFNTANDCNFNFTELKKITTNLTSHYSRGFNGSTYFFDNLKWVIISSKKEGVKEEEIASLVKKLINHQKTKSKYFDIDQCIYTLPAAFEAGLSTAQIATLLIRPDESSGMSGYHYQPFRESLEEAVKYKLPAETIFKVFNNQMDHKGYAFFSFPGILSKSVDILKLTPEEVMSFWEDTIDRHKTKGIHIFANLEAKLNGLSLFANENSPSAIRLREAILNRDFKSIENDDLVKKADDEFPVKESPLTLSRETYRINKPRSEGEADLTNLALNGESEGLWAFSESNQTWYSMGGETTLKEGRVRHEFYDFDLSELANDLELYHTHPVKLADTLEDVNNRITTDPNLRWKITACDMAMPSLADMHNFLYLFEIAKVSDNHRQFKIFHANGVTNVEIKPASREGFQHFFEHFHSFKKSAMDNLIKHSADMPLKTFIETGLILLDEELPDNVRISSAMSPLKLTNVKKHT